MEKYKIEKDIPLFAVHVTTFPNGVKQVFDELVKNFGHAHSYYGISWLDADGKVQYHAAAEQPEGEANDNNYETLIIEKGEYLFEAIHNWMSKTDCIKDIFGKLMQINETDKTKPCVEWYKNDEEMLCMMKTVQ